jgi:L-rhamnose isomerase
MIKALLMALVEPIETLRRAEAAGDFTTRLAMLEELKTLPFAAVWDYYCLKSGVPVGPAWLDEVKSYETTVLSGR